MGTIENLFGQFTGILVFFFFLLGTGILVDGCHCWFLVVVNKL